MESIFAASITGVLTLVGVIISNSKSRAVTECKIDELSARVEKHNSMIERQYRIEQDVAVLKNDVVTLYHKAGEK
ncbi:MAG: hypothetical protein IJ087_12260 [Eggerthellaceae bacterium]|nr:hypothetical protein [Eggerthellaceae bacterium]